MHFSKLGSFLAAVASLSPLALADNVVSFQSVDDVDRVVRITPNAGMQEYADFEVPAGQTVDVTIPDNWSGNWFARPKGEPMTPGMLGEVTFNAAGTWFDVSAIVDASDVDNVSQLYPFSDPGKPVAGCAVWPCNEAYYHPDDIQTKHTSQSHLVQTLSKNGYQSASAKRAVAGEDNGPSYEHKFALGKF